MIKSRIRFRDFGLGGSCIFQFVDFLVANPLGDRPEHCTPIRLMPFDVPLFKPKTIENCTMEKVVLLADDEMIVRKGLSYLFLETFAIKSIDHVSDCSTLMSSLRHKTYSHLIVETLLPDGPTSRILSFIRELYPKLQVMVYSRHDDEYIRRTLLAQGIYYVSKKNHEEEQLRQFGRFVNNEISQAMFKRMERDNKIPQLTPREFEIYLLLLQDKSTSEIAKELNITRATVSTIKRKILDKQNVTHWRHVSEMSHFQLLTVEGVN